MFLSSFIVFGVFSLYFGHFRLRPNAPAPLVSILHSALYNSVGIALCRAVALVVELLTLAKTERHFYA